MTPAVPAIVRNGLVAVALAVAGDVMVTPGVATAPTVSVNVSDVVSVPSLTVTVIVVVPDWLASGVTVTVRLVPLPPKTIFAFGTRVVFEEAPETVRAAA